MVSGHIGKLITGLKTHFLHSRNESDPNLTSRESLLQRERWEVGEIVLITIGALCQQGSARDPSTSAARTLLLALFILAVLTYTAYSASVISLISLLPFTQDDRQADLNLDLMDTSKALLTDTNIDWHRKVIEDIGRTDESKALVIYKR